MSRNGRLVIGLGQHGSLPIECPVRRPEPGRAVATFSLPDGMRATIALRREAGHWKLDGLFDAGMAYRQLDLVPPGDPQPIPKESRLVPRPDGPPEPSGAVTVREAASGRRCPPVDTDRYPDLSGGCTVNLAIGQFAGRWRQDLAQRRDGWRAGFDSMVGTSGWRLDGALTARGPSPAIAIDRREGP